MSDPLETILLQCAQAAPEPWYPSGYAQANGMKRDDLDPFLDQLRMAGLVHLTDWVQGKGQGYALTAEGERVLQSPRELARVRAGKVRVFSQVAQPVHPADRPMAAFERGEQIRAAFLSPSPPLVSYALILINIAWFLWGTSIALQHGKLNKFLYGSGDPDVLKILSQTGALAGNYIVDGGWNWARLITCCFVHIGLLHLGVNMYSLWVVGPFFEQLWGRLRFLILYLIAGLGGSCAMVIYQDPRIIGAGASGALWGILAAHAVWVVANRRYLPRQLASQMLRQVLIVLVINVGITYGVPNISAAAHFGGGAVGAVTALLLHWHRYGGYVTRGLALIGLIATPVLCVGAAVDWRARMLHPQHSTVDLNEATRQAEHRAWQTYQQQWEVLQRKDEAELTAEEVEQIIAPCREARKHLEAAVEVVRQTQARLKGPERARLQALVDKEEDLLDGWKKTEETWRKRAKHARVPAQHEGN
jgi:membrane associated rhomboid family serine protease